MADFISGVIGQLGRPMVKADQFNGIADALGRGIESVGKRQQLEGQKNEAENKKRGLLALSSVLKSANNPEQAKKILNQALSNGYLDEDDIQGMMMPDGNGINFQLIGDVLKMEYPELLDGGISNDATTSKTIYYNNGTSVSLMNDGRTRYVADAEGNQLTGEDRKNAIIEGQKSGIQESADKQTAVDEAANKTELSYSSRKAQAEADKQKTVQLAKDSVLAAKSAQSTFGTLKSANVIYDRAISAIDKGANSGAFAKLLPTFKKETLELQNAIREAGLNTISGVTLGAISKPELELALAVDIPEGMDEKDLKPYLQKKKKANIKLMKELNKMSSFLSKKGNTVAMWNEKWGGDTAFDASDKPNAIKWDDLK